MAVINTIKARVLNKYDLFANYNNFIPLRGEICLCIVGESSTPNGGLNGDTTKKPIVGIKVGDGVTQFNNLPWVQAIAGDVSTFIKGITNEAKFNELVNALISTADFATAEALAEVDRRKASVFRATTTVPTTGWTNYDGGKLVCVNVSVPGIREADVDGDFSVIQSGDETTDKPIRDALSLITRVKTMDDYIAVYATEVPPVAIPVKIEVIR